MEIRPILSAMLRNKTGPLLIAMQVAITVAIVTNAAFIIKQRVDTMNRPTGFDQDNLVVVNSVGFGTSYDQLATKREDLEAMRAMPGVRYAGYLNRPPLSGGGSSNQLRNKPEEDGAISAPINYYSGDEALMDAMGLTLSAGRWFTADDIRYDPDNKDKSPRVMVITKAYADKLFPDGNAVGNMVYNGLGEPTRVIGVISRMQGAWVHWDNLDNVGIYGDVPEKTQLGYMIRTEAGLADQLVPKIEARLQEINHNRVITSVRTERDIMDHSYTQDQAMVSMLTGVSTLLIGVTILGMIGLAAFNVNQRRKQIGTRRALGATRRDILRYFLTEALLITVIGAFIGTILALVISWWMGTTFNLTQLDWRFIPPVFIGIVVIGVLAVAGPARRASFISPALATRSA